MRKQKINRWKNNFGYETKLMFLFNENDLAVVQVESADIFCYFPYFSPVFPIHSDSFIGDLIHRNVRFVAVLPYSNDTAASCLSDSSQQYIYIYNYFHSPQILNIVTYIIIAFGDRRMEKTV
jgi:hypothetical protein